MLLFETISKRRIWGTPRLHDYDGDTAIEKVGSVYTVSAIREISTIIRNGERKRRGLYDVVQEEPELFGLQPGEPFPLIISLTAADDNLSIQVHPTDAYAKVHEASPFGKSEAWYFITPPKDGWIYAEQRLQSKDEITQTVAANDYAKVLNEYPVSQGDFVFIPCGTIHALTKGSLVYEIQQGMDVTYRFYDYDRIDKDGKKRELHVKDALETLIPEQHVKKSSFAVGETAAELPFTCQHLKAEGQLTNDQDIAVIFTVLSGELQVEGYQVGSGQSIMLLPNEIIAFTGVAEGVLAIPHMYWRKTTKLFSERKK